MDIEFIIAITVFFLVYALFIWDRFNRAVVSLLGGGSLIVLGVIVQDEAVKGIDFNTIGLLVGMMVIVSVCQRTGMFQYMAISAVKLVKGDPWRMLVALSTVTASTSAFLDNVTTVLLIAPITLLIIDELKLPAYPYLATQILASNIGGTATYIGDPPNIMIGSAVGFTFMDFVMNTAPLMVIIMAAIFVVMWLIYGRSLKVEPSLKARIMQFKEAEAITDRTLLVKCLVVLSLVICGFVFQEQIGLRVATIALFGSAVLLLISGVDFHHVAEKVEWTTIFFFVGLYVIVHALEKVNFISALASNMLSLTGGHMETTVFTVLWLSAIASAFIDNIPFVATMIPMIKGMAPSMGGMEAIEPLWWALSIGACLGGNGTIIGASANVIVAGFAARSGHPIGFFKFMRLAFPLMLMSIAISTVYIYLRYL
ncbi:MAG: ArsB/NhaD family transporter [Deltaproteobacteria bacterium]|nr:ArsB/NhaD family transporter [Deltaproteobacteria bacterium]